MLPKVLGLPAPSASKARWFWISRSRSRSRRARDHGPNSLRRFQMLISRLRRRRHSRDCAHDSLPFRLFDGQLLLALSRKAVVLEFALSFAAFPSRGEPALALHSVKRRVQRPVLDLEDIFGAALNVFGDLMSVRGAQQQRAENQHVERSPEEINLVAAS